MTELKDTFNSGGNDGKPALNRVEGGNWHGHESGVSLGELKSCRSGWTWTRLKQRQNHIFIQILTEIRKKTFRILK